MAANYRPYTYWPLVILSCSITQHLAVTFIFLAVFVRLKEGTLDPRSLVCVSVLCFFAGYLSWTVLGRTDNDANNYSNRGCFHRLRGVTASIYFFFYADLKTLKPSIMMFLVLMSLSPVLRTLTAATSSDSIWALSAVLFILNALLADYTATGSKGMHEGCDLIFSTRSFSAQCIAGFPQYYP